MTNPYLCIQTHGKIAVIVDRKPDQESAQRFCDKMNQLYNESGLFYSWKLQQADAKQSEKREK